MNYARKIFSAKKSRPEAKPEARPDSPRELALAAQRTWLMSAAEERVARAVAAWALLEAVELGDLRVATRLLPFADLAFTKDGHNAVEHAIVHLRGALRVAFLEKLMPWFDANARNANGQTLLLFAADYGSVGSVSFLLPRSDANAVDAKGRTALIIVASLPAAGPACLRMLLPRSDPHAVDHLGNTALHEAASVSTENVKILLPVSNLRAQNRDGLTPLMASLRQRHETTHLLLPFSDARIRDNEGLTALDHALRRLSLPGVNEEMAQRIRNRMAQNDQEDLSAVVAEADPSPKTDRRPPKSL